MIVLTQRNLRRLGLALSLAIPLVGGPAWASGGQPKSTDTAQRDPMEEASQAYNHGLRMRDKAWEHEKRAAAATDDEVRAAEKKKARKRYTKAMKSFRMATGKNPAMHEAFSSLGYSLRKLGRYDEALTAYDRALQLNPGYAQAIEYRAEAHLELGRLADVQAAYLHLFREDRARADQLMVAMIRWREGEAPRGDVAEGDAQAFLRWVGEREEVAGQTPAVAELRERKW